MAERSEADPELINEYIRLLGEIHLLHRFFRHLHIPLSGTGNIPSSEADREIWLDRINNEILEKENRYKELNEFLKNRNIIVQNEQTLYI
jgi:hypothetical protein